MEGESCEQVGDESESVNINVQHSCKILKINLNY